MDSTEAHVTQLLHRASEGHASAINELMSVVYDELRALAQYHMNRERADHTLQGTALVHEAYLKLVNQTDAQWRDRAHFFAVASRAIRQILVDHARARKSEKRGGKWHRTTISGLEDQAEPVELDILELDDALKRLSILNARQADIVTLRFFGGLSIDETAEALGISPRTADGDWAMARAWLRRELHARGDA